MKLGAYGISWKEWLEMTSAASASLLEFANSAVCQALRARKNKSHFQVVMSNMYNRAVLWLKDSVIAKEPIHIQIAATCTRSMFEHLIDLKWLTLNPQSAEAFTAFTFVRRFDMADKILKESLRNPAMDPRLNKSAIALATNTQSRARRDELCRKYGWITKTGQTKTPLHWWGENAEQRALAVDPKGRKYIALYVTIYAELSNQVHPGMVGLRNISPEGVLSLFLAAQQMTQDFFREVTSLVCQHFPMPSKVTTVFQDKFSDNAVWGIAHPKIILPM